MKDSKSLGLYISLPCLLPHLIPSFYSSIICRIAHQEVDTNKIGTYIEHSYNLYMQDHP